MKGSNLPTEIWKIIFEYDSTYHDVFSKCLDEVPDGYIYMTHCRKRNRCTNTEDTLQLGLPIKTDIDFTIWLNAGDSPYIDIRLERMLFICDFTKLSLITPGGVHRFIYDNGDVKNARLDCIDTRLRTWEWWIQMDNDDENKKYSAFTWVSCSYHQIHGYLFETRVGNGFTHLEITEQATKQLHKAMISNFSNFSNFLVKDYHDVFIMPGVVCSIPNARFRDYKIRDTLESN